MSARPASVPPVVLLMGPTAVGKSSLALRLAERLPAEIVSVDSAQMYRGMDIGTAKPDAATRARVRHHLIDLLEPVASYSAARFVTDATAAIADIRARGHVPLLVGGTMLYFKALTEGLSALPSADASLRRTLDERAAREGWPRLHAELAAVDAASAARLAPTDSQRIQRALEVFQLTGQPLSSLQRARAVPALGATVQIALFPESRAGLHATIAERFAAMLEAGLVDELAALRARHPSLTPDLPSMRSVGYRQSWQYLDGDGDLELLRQRGIAATRQLAKRQLTWLRAWPAHALPASSTDVAERALALVRGASSDHASPPSGASAGEGGMC